MEAVYYPLNTPSGRRSRPQRALEPPSEKERERGRRFGLWVREAQARRNVTNKEAAHAAGISATYFGILRNDCYEAQTDKVIRPSEEVVRALARALGANAAEGLDAAGWAAVSPLAGSLQTTPSGASAYFEVDGQQVVLPEDALRRLDLEIELAKRRGERN
jgi:hypothetical protein